MAVKFSSKANAPVGIVQFGAGYTPELQSKEILGGKGANLVEMASLGLPVPPGFVIPCAASIKYMNSTSSVSQSLFLTALWAEVEQGMNALSDHFGYDPLVSVRSGARVSMPGMMDTILNVGLTTDMIPHWQELLGERTVLDSYRRLLQMYGSVVFEIDMGLFDQALEKVKHSAGVQEDTDLSASDLQEVISQYERVFLKAGHEMPNTVESQIHGAIKAVFRSWMNPRAVEYRKIHSIPGDWGTAVTVQSMVFGNLNDNSATGVLFTRCPSTGDNGIIGEFLVNAQGEDVVAGIRTPEPLMKMSEWNAELHTQLANTVCNLEKHYRDMQDVEFTVQDGELYILQTRSGKRSPKAAFKVACDLVSEGMIPEKEALSRVTQQQLLSLMQDTIDPTFKKAPHLVGIAAGGGLVTGVAMFSSEAAINCKEPCVLVRKETDPDDIGGMNASVGILTATGGLTSHAAVVARGMNKTCVVGCTNMNWQESPPKAVILHPDSTNNFQFVEGCKVTMDGATGNVWFDIDVPVVAGGKSPEVIKMLSWAMGAVPERITLHPHDQGSWWKELTGVTSGTVYVDTALIEPPLVASASDFDAPFIALEDALLNCPASEVILDLSGLASHWDGDDMMLSALTGNALKPGAVLSAKVGVLLKYQEQLRKRTMVILPDSDKSASTLLLGAGYKLSCPVATVADLLNTSGAVQVTPEVIQNVFGGQAAFDTLCAMVTQQKGVKLSGGAPVYWYDSLNKVS